MKISLAPILASCQGKNCCIAQLTMLFKNAQTGIAIARTFVEKISDKAIHMIGPTENWNAAIKLKIPSKINVDGRLTAAFTRSPSKVLASTAPNAC